MIDSHHPPGGTGLPASPAARQPAATVRPAEAVLADPDRQLGRRWRQAAGVVRWEDCRFAVFARAGIPEQHRGPIRGELPVRGEGALSPAGGVAVRPQRASRRAGADAGLRLERVSCWYLAAFRRTRRIVTGRQGGPDDPAWAAGRAG